MEKAVLIGRYQPFHKGHLKYVEDAAKKHEEVIIVIGSTNESRTQKNPFNFEERKEMIDQVLKSRGIEYQILELEDAHNDEKWTKNLIQLVGDSPIFYTDNEWVQGCLKKFNLKFQEQEILDRGVYNATRVRELIANKENWKEFVPEEIHKYLETLVHKINKEYKEQNGK